MTKLNMTRFWKTKEGKRILYVVAVIAILIIGRTIFAEINKSDKNNIKVENALRTVEVARVFDISGDRLPLPLIGRIESKSEAIIRSEVAGEISHIYRDFGDAVKAGQIIAEVSNDSQKAEVLRAQGVLQGAQASLLKVTGGSDDSRSLIKESIRSSFTIADDAVRNKADQFIEDPEKTKPDIVAASSDYFIRKRAEDKRFALTQMFKEWKNILNSLNSITESEALLVYVLQAQSNLEQVRDFLDDMASIAAGFEPDGDIYQSTIDKWRSDISTARASVNSSLSSLISSYNTLRSQVDSGNNGGEDILSAKAIVTQAEAGVLLAQASLEKTIIRSPISGEINQISIKLGDFVNAFQEVAVVANNSALEITTFINEEDRKTISVGSNVKIEGGYTGVVTRIAPALNKQTGKIEVAIGVDDKTSLTNGQSVSIEITRTSSSSELNDSGVITIPISALKITSTKNFVFTVSEQNTLLANEVSVGSIIGEKIIITDGLSPTMEIVLDARGLKDGQEVTINR